MLDNENRLIGVITARDLVEVVGDELNEDYAKLAGLSAEEDLGGTDLPQCKKAASMAFYPVGHGPRRIRNRRPF